MKNFVFKCANCKCEQTVYVHAFQESTGDNSDLRELSDLFDKEITDVGWVKMDESEVAGFHEYLCSKCK